MTEQQRTEAETVEEELDDTEQDGEETEDGDGDEQSEPEWTPPTREQWEAAQGKLKRAREQARKLREAGKAAPTSQGAADPQAAAAAQADVEKWQTRAVSTAAKAELLARGADPDMVELALGRLKPSSVEFDDDDRPDLDEWLDEIETRYPKLFKQPETPVSPARPKAGKVETPNGRPVRPAMSLGERIVANSLGATSRRR